MMRKITALFSILFQAVFVTITLSGVAYAEAVPPVTVFAKSPTLPNGKNDWYVTPVNVTLSATDLQSGVASINYKIDSGNWVVIPKADTLNLAPNPSLETTFAGSSINTLSWEAGLVDGQVAYSRDPIGAAFDSISVKINSTGAAWHSINNQASYAAAAPLSNMTAEVWLKTNSVTGTASFNIYAVLQDTFGNITYSLLDQSSTLTGTNGWTKLSKNFVVNDANAIGVYLEIGVEGTGILNIDGITISNSLKSADATFNVSSDGEHTVQYYSTDRSGNIEATKSSSFKIDQTPPGNWRNASAFRGITGGASDHHLYVTTTVDDITSGLSTLTDKYQYHTITNPGFGRFSDLMKCSSNWQPNDWAILITPPFLPGTHTAILLTPKTDFCNSNWKECKTVRFYSEDLAGNSAIKDFCINGPWIKVRGGGIVGSRKGIDMLSESTEDNTDGIVEASASNINFFTSTNDWIVKENNVPPELRYADLLALAGSPTALGSQLPTTNGVYRYTGNLTLNSSTVPNTYATATFRQVIFILGDLRITQNLTTANSSAVLFVVSGNVEIAKSVTDIKAAIYTDGNFYTAYDTVEGDKTNTLYLKGVFVANRFVFQRTLQGANNKDVTSEDFTYEPKYGSLLREYIGTNAVRWVSTE